MPLLIVLGQQTGNPKLQVPRTKLPSLALATRLTSTTQANIHNTFARYTRDGQRIVFQRSSPAGDQIWKMSSRGTDESLLGVGKSPDWSPDGRKVIFTAGGNGNQQSIMIAGDTGADRTRVNIPRVSDGAGVETFFTPRFSPDGTKIVYVRSRAEQFDVFIIGIDGSGQRRLTRNAGKNILPTWSPDGKTILFASDRDSSAGKMDLFTVDIQGSSVQRITSMTGMTTAPCWSPDGSKIAFSSDIAGNLEIFTMDLSGRNLKNVSNAPGRDSRPSWSPDGRTLVFDSMGEAEVNGRVSDGTLTNIIAISAR